MLPIKQSSMQEIKIPDETSDVQEMTAQASACFEAIQSCASPSVMSNAWRQAKYFKLCELRNRIRTVESTEYPEIQRLKKQIRQEMRSLKDQYQTNSHWLMLTQKQSHLVQTTPDISVVPHLKIDLSDLKSSLERIAARPRGIEKVRALQFLFNEAVSSGQHNVDELLAEIQRFSDSHLTLSEKILALKQISWRDKDSNQMHELNKLVDPTGRNFVQHFLSSQTTPKEAVSYISVVLRDRIMHNHAMTPIELVKTWPQCIDRQDTESRMKWTLALMKMERRSSIQDPFTNVVVSYLLNIVDPTGLHRCAELHKRHRNGAAFAREIASVIDTLEAFGFNGAAVYQRYAFELNEGKQVQGISIKELESKMKRETLSRDEIAHLARELKIAVASDWMTFDMKSLLEGSASFKDLVGDRMEKCASLAEKYETILKGMDDTAQQAAMISNMLLVCHRLMQIGEFGLGFTLYSSGIDFTRRSCANAWEIALQKHQKYDDFLRKVCDPAMNLKNLRKLIANRNAKTVCIPFFPIVLKDIVQFEEQISQPRDNLINLIFDNHKSIADQLVDKLASGEIEGNRCEWAKKNFFKEISKLLRAIETLDTPAAETIQVKQMIVRLLQQEGELELEILRQKRGLNQKLILMRLYYGKHRRAFSLSSLLSDS